MSRSSITTIGFGISGNRSRITMLGFDGSSSPPVTEVPGCIAASFERIGEIAATMETIGSTRARFEAIGSLSVSFERCN